LRPYNDTSRVFLLCKQCDWKAVVMKHDRIALEGEENDVIDVFVIT